MLCYEMANDSANDDGNSENSIQCVEPVTPGSLISKNLDQQDSTTGTKAPGGQPQIAK